MLTRSERSRTGLDGTRGFRLVPMMASWTVAFGSVGLTYGFLYRILRLSDDVSDTLAVVFGISIVLLATVLILVYGRHTLPRSCYWLGPKGKLVFAVGAIALMILLFHAASGKVAAALAGGDLDQDLAMLSCGLILAGVLLVSLAFLGVIDLVKAARTGASHLPPVSCPHCGYNMKGLYETRCPECGTRYTLDELLAANSRQDPPEAR